MGAAASGVEVERRDRCKIVSHGTFAGLSGFVLGVAEIVVFCRQLAARKDLLVECGCSGAVESMIKNILCAVDRSPDSLQAFGYAIALARWQKARLSLLEVIEEAPPPGVTRAPKSGSVPTETRTTLERDLRRVLTARRASDVQVEIFMRKGKVVQEILAQAKASRSDLLVIGSHGRGGVQRLVLGSVAEKVLRLATCPVLTVRSGVRLARRRRSPFETILCPTDFSAAANRAVAYAKRLAQEADAKLIVMTAVEWPFGEAVIGKQEVVESLAKMRRRHRVQHGNVIIIGEERLHGRDPQLADVACRFLHDAHDDRFQRFRH